MMISLKSDDANGIRHFYKHMLYSKESKIIYQ